MTTAKTITKQKATGAHYTPPELAQFVSRAIIRNCQFDNDDDVNVLDPSCGDGELLLAIANEVPRKALPRTRLIGIESDPKALDCATQRLCNRAGGQLSLVCDDFLGVCQGKYLESDLFAAESCAEHIVDQADVIIANPPYVRTQVLGAEKAQELAKAFDLKGRVDLYQAFLVAMTLHLRPGGIIGVITSNKFLVSKGCAALREFMAEHYDILELYDFGDTKLFTAAVLPSVFIGKKRIKSNNGHGKSGRFVRIYEEKQAVRGEVDQEPHRQRIISLVEDGQNGLFPVGPTSFRITAGALQLPSIRSEPWSMLTASELQWVRKIDDAASSRVTDHFSVRVGIKSNADNVFIRPQWSDLPKESTPEDELLHKLLSQGNMRPWVADEAGIKRILYPHSMLNGKRKTISLEPYPRAEAYLTEYRKQLEARTYLIQANREWYELWVPQQPDAWQKPKVVFPDISPDPRFCFDAKGRMVNGNCYWISANTEQEVRWLYLTIGVANTALMTRYHDLVFCNKLYAGRRRYLSQYVERYPLPDADSKSGKVIVETARRLCTELLTTQQQHRLQQKVERATAEAFQVEPIIFPNQD